VKGLLIADRVRQGDEGHGKTCQDAGVFDIRTWGNLLATTEAMHKEFLDVVKMRASSDDPRMKGLSADDAAADLPSASGRKRKASKKVTRKKKARMKK
jgi:hypothetical protein